MRLVIGLVAVLTACAPSSLSALEECESQGGVYHENREECFGADGADDAPAPTNGDPETSATERPTPRPTPRAPRTTPRPTPEPVARDELILLEQGYTYFPGDTEYVQYAVVFENPNQSDWVAERTSVNVTWYNAEGGIAGTESTYLSLGLPGQRTAIGGVVFDVTNPTDMEVQFRVGDWQEVDFQPGEFTFENVTTEPQQYGGPTTKGQIVSSFEQEQEFVQIVAVYKDANGDVLGGDSGYAQFVPAGGSVAFDINVLGELTGIASTDMYASP